MDVAMQMMHMYFTGLYYDNIILKIALNEFLHKMIVMVLFLPR